VALAAVLTTGVCAIEASAASPDLQINWSVNGGPINHTMPAGSELGGGAYGYEGVATDPGSGLVLVYDLTGRPDSAIGGNLSIINELVETIQVFIEVILPFSPSLHNGSDLAGSLGVGLTTGPDGGTLGSRPPYLWQTLIDGSPVGPSASLLAHPFYVTHSGPASSSVTTDFGDPDPVPGPPVLESIGFEMNFELTSLDAASFLNELGVYGCAADIDGNGEVGAGDLSSLLVNWGPCPGDPLSCSADFDGDGNVGITDLLTLLSGWGPCP
jgi:hypothetical protein